MEKSLEEKLRATFNTELDQMKAKVDAKDSEMEKMYGELCAKDSASAQVLE
jgi:hypothetical protein